MALSHPSYLVGHRPLPLITACPAQELGQGDSAGQVARSLRTLLLFDQHMSRLPRPRASASSHMRSQTMSCTKCLRPQRACCSLTPERHTCIRSNRRGRFLTISLCKTQSNAPIPNHPSVDQSVTDHQSSRLKHEHTHP